MKGIINKVDGLPSICPVCSGCVITINVLKMKCVDCNTVFKIIGEGLNDKQLMYETVKEDEKEK